MPPVQTSTLHNGVRVVTETIPYARGVGMVVLIDAGPQDEAEDQSGLAHLCEHSLFLGTTLRGESDIAAMIDGAGGQMGAFTARDYTCLHSTVSGDYVPLAIDLLGDLLTDLRFAPERLSREIDVVEREIDAHRDQPELWLDSEMKSRLWRNDPLGRDILGSPSSLQTMTPNDVFGFLSHHYTPDRITVAAAGAIDHGDFTEQVNDSLWQLAGRDPRHPLPDAVCHGGVVVDDRPQRLAQMTVMLPAPCYHHSQRLALHVLVALMGGGMSSRLYRDIRERRGLAHQVTANLHAYQRGGVLAIEMATTPESVLPTFTAVIDHLMRLVTEEIPIGEEEFYAAKMRVRGQADLASDSLQTRVSRLATQNHYFGQVIESDELLRQIDAVEMADVVEQARTVIAEGIPRVVLGTSGPFGPNVERLHTALEDLRGCLDYLGCND